MPTKNTAIYNEETVDDTVTMDARYGDMQLSPRQLLEIGGKTSIDEVKGNPGLARAAARKVLEHYTTIFAGDKDMVTAAYYSSVEEVNNAQAKAESEENKEGKAWIDFMPEDVQKNVRSVQAWEKRQAQERHEQIFGTRPYTLTKDNTFKRYTSTELERGLKRVDPKAASDPDYCKAVVKSLQADQENRWKQFQHDQKVLLGRSLDTVLANNGDVFSIPEEDWAQLDSASHQKVLDLVDAYKAGSTQMGTEQVNKLTDAALASMDYDDVKIESATLGQAEKNNLWTRWYNAKKSSMAADQQQQALSLLAQQGIHVAGYDVNRTLVKDILRATYGNFADFEKKNAQAAETLAGVLQNELSLYYQSQNDTNSLKSFSVVKQDMARLFGNGHLNFNDAVNSPLNYTWKKLPDDAYTDVKGVIREIAQNKYHVNEPTEAQLDYEYYSLILNPNKITSLAGLHLSKSLVEEIQADAQKERGEPLRGGQLLLEYVLRAMHMNVSKPPTIIGGEDIASGATLVNRGQTTSSNIPSNYGILMD